MIGNLPLWLVVVMWFLQRTNRTMVTYANYDVQMRQIADNRRALPFPKSLAAAWLTEKCYSVLDAEHDRIYTIHLAALVAGGSQPEPGK